MSITLQNTFSWLILLSLIRQALLSMDNAYLVIPPSYITILLLQYDASQGKPIGLGRLHMQDELRLQRCFTFCVDDDSEGFTGHGATRSLWAMWVAKEPKQPFPVSSVWRETGWMFISPRPLVGPSSGMKDVSRPQLISSLHSWCVLFPSC